MATHQMRFALAGISCGGCVKTIESLLTNQQEVDSASVNFAEKELTLLSSFKPKQVVSLLKKAGYEATLVESDVATLQQSKANQNQEWKESIRAAIISLAVGSGIMAWSMSPYQIDLTTDRIAVWFIAIISSVAMYFSGHKRYAGAWKAFKNRSANMDSLITLGTSMAWVYSMVVILFTEQIPKDSQYLYFETALFILGFVSFGKALEIRSRTKTSSVVESLLNLRPKTATLIEEGQERIIEWSAIQVGGCLKIRPGDQIPVDGVVIEGRSTVDESMLTGEWEPVNKETGSQVIGGSTNHSGSFIIRAENVGESTVLSAIIRAVKNAQNTKPELAKLADTICHYFAPTVICIALLAMSIWFFFAPNYMLVIGLATLVIACPCALGLATPTSVIAGIGKAAEVGALIQDGNALQNMAKLTHVIFDKTGTLTEGKPIVEQIISPTMSEDELLRIAASVETHSEHPLAKAIVKHATNLELQAVSDFESFSGFGVQAMLEGKQVLVGGSRFFEERQVKLLQLEPAKAGVAPIFVAVDGQMIGAIFLTDAVKADALETVQKLNKLGVRTVILSGDRQEVVEHVAIKLQVQEHHGLLLPQDKQEFIKNLQTKGAIVCMVGDGINDAPALAQANVGCAVGSGSDTALQVSDIILLKHSSTTILHTLQVARLTMRNIKQNLFGAFIYNVLGIPVAAGALYPFFGVLLHPTIAGIAMALSSLTVVLNSNRLRQIKI